MIVRYRVKVSVGNRLKVELSENRYVVSFPGVVPQEQVEVLILSTAPIYVIYDDPRRFINQPSTGMETLNCISNALYKQLNETIVSVHNPAVLARR